MHAGFSDMVSSSKATKYLIMNNREDADMKGVSSSGICRAVSKYLDLGGVKVVENNDAPSFMQREYSGLQYIHAPLGAGGKHDPEKLVCTIFVDYFGKDNINASTVMYDLDGTLWNDNGTPQEIEAGMENLKLYKGIIVSGNNYEHVRDVLMGHGNSETDGVYCFCNYGNTYFSTDEPDRVYDITNEFTIDRSVVDAFKMIPEYSGKLHLRGGAVLTIKPLEDRETQLARVMYIIGNNGGRYKADIAGRTSIDITRVEYGKATMIPRIAVMLGLDLSDCVFVGNEIDSGSEEGISRLGIGTVNVRDVFECNVFLKSWRMAHRTVEKADEGQCIAG
jgi:hydroxymethylpyrimidine pyrophosphatase-like HAD family hydrolase